MTLSPRSRGISAMALCTVCLFLIGGVANAGHRKAKMRAIACAGDRHVAARDFEDVDFTVQRMPSFSPVRKAKVTATIVDLILIDGDNAVPPTTLTGTTNSKGQLRLIFEYNQLGTYRIDYTVKKKGFKTIKQSAQFSVQDRTGHSCPTPP